MLDTIIGGLIFLDCIVYMLICFLIDQLLLKNRFKLKNWMVTLLVGMGSILPRNNLLMMFVYFLVSIVAFYLRAGVTMLAAGFAMASIAMYQRRIITAFRDDWVD